MDRKNFTIRLDLDLEKKLKMQAVIENCTVSEIVNRLIRKYLEERPQ